VGTGRGGQRSIGQDDHTVKEIKGFRRDGGGGGKGTGEDKIYTSRDQEGDNKRKHRGKKREHHPGS